MAELKTKPTRASVAAFLAAVEPEERRRDCRAVARLMAKATGAKAELWGPSIVGFGRFRYQNGSGRSVEWFRVGFSPRKQDLTLYLLPGARLFPDLLARLGRHRTGQSCLYLKRLADVDLGVLERLIGAALARTRTT